MAERKNSSIGKRDWEQKENRQDNDRERRDFEEKMQLQITGKENSSQRHSDSKNQYAGSYPKIEISVEAIKSNNLRNPNFINNFSKNQNIENITAFLVSNMEIYIETVSSNISKDLLTAILNMVAKACGSTVATTKIYVLKSTLQKKFVRAICSFLLGIKVNDRKHWQFRENFGYILGDILIVLENSVQFVPISWKYLKSIINTITSILPHIQQNKDIQLPDDFGKRVAVLRVSIQEIAADLNESSESDTEDDNTDQSDPEDDDSFNNNILPSKLRSEKGFFNKNSKNQIGTIQRSNAKSRYVVLNPKLKNYVHSVKLDNFQNPKFLNGITESQSAEEITVFLMSNMEVYLQILSSDISDELLMAILNLVAKLCTITFSTNKSYVLKSTLQKKFVNKICSFLSGLIVDDTKDDQFWQHFGDVLNDILTILENAMQLIPMTTWEYLRIIVKTTTLVLPVLQQSKNIKLTKIFIDEMACLRDKIQKIKIKFEKVSKPTIVKSTNNECEANDDSDQNEPDCDYRFINVFPEIEELINPDRPFLRKNNIRGKYTSLQHYLGVHFRLIREDFINPIREDICDYLNNIKRKMFNIKVHKRVSFIDKRVEKNLICFRIKIEVSQTLQESIQTGQNKRFMHGTLLFFSTDNFQSMFCGRVVGSDELENGILLVNLPHKRYIDYKVDYTMIECIVFFEPYYQVLNALQKLFYQQIPMEKYLLQLETNVLPPKYIKNVILEIPDGLNISQKNALSAALNKEMVIIQGPPGTGKTFLGRTIVQMLLQFKECWQNTGPILVLCYTNHALDQFLDDLYRFTDKIVRLGGKSNNLFEVKEKFGPEGLLKLYLEYEHGICFDDYNEENEHDFNLLVRSLIQNSYYGDLKFKSPFFEDVDACLVPIKITKWLREKANLSSIFKKLKCVQNDIYKVHKELLQIYEQEKYEILAKIICEWDYQKFKRTEYRFESFELFCWLLCDDGTVSFNQNEKIEVPFENSLVEQDKIYTLLFNFVLGNKQYTGYTTYLGVHSLKCIAAELSSYLNIKANQNKQRYLKEQYDFLLNKIEYLKFCLETDFGEPEVIFEDYPDPFAIPCKHRWQLYKHWVEIYKMGLKISLDDLYENYQHVYVNYNDLKEDEDIRVFKTMDIIGMTTTCSARLRSTLEKLSSPIVIVEEAAEVLESHIIASLTKDCQHLILLGDHQQLRPTTADYTIEKKYNLGTSLFERMIINNIECHTLNVQHRMRPEISRLISPLFYKELFNHPSVEMYPLVSGIGSPLYFIDHTEPEEPYLESSKMNMHEAEFLLELAIYLLNNNYEPQEITILAAYLGQSYVLKDLQKKSKHRGVKKIRISVVDNFQGEENKIILLSLVRNNSDKKVGFLSTYNRVCVALSRAKEGLYIMGNMTHLCEASNTWKSIRATLKAQQAIGNYLPLHCKNHKDHITLVSKPNDFSKVPEGGCDQSCNALLECGHNCIKMCHRYDVDHKFYNCEKPCLRLLCDDPDHKCKKQCFEHCGFCHYPVNRKLNCGHEKTFLCAKNIDNYECVEIIETQLNCGHQQNIPCRTLESHKCSELVEFTPQCGHTQNIMCFKKSMLVKESSETERNGQILNTYECPESVGFTLKCGHTRNLLCFIKTILIKESSEAERYAQMLNTYKCPELVEFTPQCGHTQNILCYEKSELSEELNKTETDSVFCNVQIEKRIPKCGHYQIVGCSEDLTKFNCQVITEITLKCGHKQEKPCFLEEKKITCSNDCGQTLRCGHKCPKKCHRIIFHIGYQCMEPCNKNLRGCRNPEIHQKCTLLCYEDCKPCTEMVINSYQSCSHIDITTCYNTKITCDRPCSKKLSCGHFCKNRCDDPCSICVQKMFKKIPDCGHKIEVQCNENPLQINCENPCTKTLDCGHNCTNKCNEPCTTKCYKQCQRLFECGHDCIKSCHENCACKMEVSPYCGHSVPIRCGDVIYADQCEILCMKVLNCGHSQLAKCNEAIENLRCIEECEKILECGHRCQEKCGPPCTSLDICKLPCNKTLNCNHSCKKMCHETCTDECLEQCSKKLKCGHRCTNRCSLECITICKSKCDKILECGHRCLKPCIEPCLKVCSRYRRCDPDERLKGLL